MRIIQNAIPTGSLHTFYHGDIDRAESEKRLIKAYSLQQENNNVNSAGSFYLVRKSSRFEVHPTYVLSFLGYHGAISHFLITVTVNRKLSLGQVVFNTVCEMVAYYSTPGTDLVKNEWLTHPVSPPPPLMQMQLTNAENETTEDDELANLHEMTDRQINGIGSFRKKLQVLGTFTTVRLPVT